MNRIAKTLATTTAAAVVGLVLVGGPATAASGHRHHHAQACPLGYHQPFGQSGSKSSLSQLKHQTSGEHSQPVESPSG